MKPNRAVVEQRAPKEVEGDTPERKLWRALDFFGTPPWASRAGGEIVRRIDPGARTIAEPAAGMGTMAEPLRDHFSVFASDIHDFGLRYPVHDFLLGALPCAQPDWVVTNPPFPLALEFLQRGLEVARSGVALLCRLAFLETPGRYEPLYVGPHPLTICAPFCERVDMQLGPWDPECSTMTAYAWYIFHKGAAPQPIQPVPPGSEARLTRHDDVRRFVKPAPAPLFDGLT